MLNQFVDLRRDSKLIAECFNITGDLSAKKVLAGVKVESFNDIEFKPLLRNKHKTDGYEPLVIKEQIDSMLSEGGVATKLKIV